jgi:hypothetical protein
MTQSLLPETVTHPIAAKLLGISEARLVELVAQGAIRQPAGRQWRRYRTSDIEHLLNRSLTPEDYLRAERSHDGRRAQVKRNNDAARFSPATTPSFLRRIAQAFIDNHTIRPRRSDDGRGGSGAPAQLWPSLVSSIS